MQSSGRVSRSKSSKPHWDDEDFSTKKSNKKHRTAYEVKRDLADYFERKQIREQTEDSWLQ
ncbi:MAG: hypothetical protein HWE27_17960 [Gammaproteobacteria bacterium]|nr:hypothetical protein [Gammaproteobacteria bacterium]